MQNSSPPASAPHPTSHVLSTKELLDRWDAVVDRALDEAGLNYCPDPIVFARRLGLTMRKSRSAAAVAIIGNEVVYPPEMTNRQWLALDIVRTLAPWLLKRAGAPATQRAIAHVMDRIVLPYSVSEKIEADELDTVNPHVPEEELRRIYLAHEGSGLMPVAG